MKSIAMLVLLSVPAAAAAQVPAVAAIAPAIERYAKTASTSDNFTVTFEQHVVATQGCTVTLLAIDDSEVSLDTLRTTLDLSTMTPTVSLEPWTGDHVVSVELATTSGDTSIAMDERSKGKDALTPDHHRVRRQDAYIINVGSASAAEAMRAALSKAITACGGQASSPAVLQRRKEADARSRREVAANAGQDSLGTALIGMCKEAVRSQLTSPSSAVFADHIMVLGDTAKTVMGDVEAMNGFGGRVKRSYLCQFKPFGDAWVPIAKPSVF